MRAGKHYLRIFSAIVVLGAVLGAVPAAAQGGACLRSQRIDNWKVIDDKTLIITDRADRQFKIAVVGTCAELQRTRFSLGFETLSELSCIRPGDAIRYDDPSFGPERCVISSIELYNDNSRENDEDNG
jgi:hypothetical protein